MSDHFHVVERFDERVCREGHGEEQLVVLAAVESAGAYVEIQLFGGHSSLVVDGQAVFVDAAAHVGAATEVEEFAAQAVAHVDHGGGADAGGAKGFDDVASRLGLEVTLQEVLASAEVGGEVEGGAGGFALGGTELREVDAFFAFEEAESEIGGAEIAAHTDEIGVGGAVAAANVGGAGGAEGGEAQGEAGERGTGVASGEIDVVALAGHADAGIEFVDVFDCEALGERHCREELAGSGVHGVEIGEVDHGGLIT